MCTNCWEERGRPANWTPQIAEALQLTRELCADHPTGGPLHVHLDDWNIDGVIKPCWWGDEDDAAIELCDKLAELLNGMPVEDRASMLAFHDGLIPPPGPS